MSPSLRRRGFTLIELMIAIAIIVIIASISISNLTRIKMHAHQTAAIKVIQTINTAQFQYEAQYGRFAPSLAELGPPQNGQPSRQAADLIDENLAAGEASGYRFTVTATSSGYVVSALPVTYNVTGACTFYSDQTTRIRRHDGPEPATAQSPLIRK